MTTRMLPGAVEREASAAPALAAGLLRLRNDLTAAFFVDESPRIAQLAREMARRFSDGGRLFVMGRAQYATDAQHMEVEFVHPVLVGKRALPAIDLSAANARAIALIGSRDIFVGLGPPQGDALVAEILHRARERGALTCALPGTGPTFEFPSASADPFVHQEIVEIVCHTLWESVHVFLEHRGSAQQPGAAGFLYPFLERGGGDDRGLLTDVAASIQEKAREVERLRLVVAHEHAAAIARLAAAITERLQSGGTLLLFGNGGSATDANDLALDSVSSPKGHRPIPAFSLASSSANVSALANDLGAEAIFQRQLIAIGRPTDIALAISTSGGSANILAALGEARRRGMITAALLGGDGGEVARRGLVDHAIVVGTDYIPRIQEVHASIYHVLLDLVHAMQTDASHALTTT